MHKQLKGNTYKWHLILSTGNLNQTQVVNSLTKVGLCEKLLTVEFDNKLIFD